ncbi:MAG TPA: hypothetical protein VEK57_32120 [Thermoanaerobaculia bacterium]|nr:hypothetical protein [Thermoanaerobaculia bacterium]
MKRALTLSLAAILTFPLLAEEPKKADEKAAQPATDTAAPAPAAPGDSAMVQAAKRANRLGRKGTSKIVITNASLKGSKGHVTTTTTQYPVNVPEPVAGPEEKLAKEKASRAADEKRLRSTGTEKEQKAATDREKRLAAAAEAAEDAGYDMEDVDPSQAEQTASEQKPPV